MGTYDNTIQKFYIAFFNRPADALGLNYWNEQITNAGGNSSAVINAFSASAEYQALYAGMSSAQTVNQIYQNLFGRAAEADGLAYWTLRLDNGTFNVGNIAYSILVGAQNEDLSVINNKATAAASFTAAMDTSAEILAYSGTAAAQTARTWLSTVTDDAASVTAAQGTVASTLATIVNTPAANGQTYTLTTGTDNIAGTSGNDTIIGDNSGTATFNVSDVINGGAGVDTLKVYSPGALENLALPNVSNVENLYVYGATLTNNATFDLSAKAAGVTSLEVDTSTAAGAVFTVKTSATQDVALKAVNAAGGGTTLNIDGAKKLTVNAVGTTANVLTVDVDAVAVTALDLVSTGAGTTGASKLTLANNGGTTLTTLNVTGAGDTTVTTALAALKTVNASAATGKFNLDVSGRAAANTAVDFAFTGGSANDSIKLADVVLGRLTSGAQLDGGAGTDKLGISDTALTAAEFAALNAAKNFETLGLNAAITLDASKLTSLKSFSLDANNAVTINNMAAGSSVATSTDITNTVVLAGATGVKDLSLTLTGTTSNPGVALTTLTVGQTDIALVSAGPGTAANVITTLNNADNSTITVTGSNDLTITTALKGTAIGSKVDANAFTGKLDVTGSALSDILIGGSGDDTLNGGTVTPAAAAVTGVTETTTVTFGALTAGQTLIIGGLTFTDGGAGSTAAQVAAAFATLANGGAGNASAFGMFSGNLTGWSTGAVGVGNTVTFTSSTANTDVTDLTVTGTGAAASLATALAKTQGVAAVTEAIQSVDKLTGNGGADTFKFLSADVDTANGVVTAEITDFKTGVDKIVGIVGGAAGSATNYVEATSAATTLAAMLTAADTALTGGVTYYVGQVGSDSYLVTDADGNGYTNVIKLTGVALDGIAMADIIA